MRIRMPFAGVFLLLLAIAGYAGLASLQLNLYINDKFLHFVTFFLLTVVFYWVVDTNRRRALHMTGVTCTLILGVGSEFLQSFLPNDRDFDLFDIAANVAGSLVGLALCYWYHNRMLERKRQRKIYAAVPGEDIEDVELGEGHENGVTDLPERSRTLEEEVDNWDENAPDDWDEDNSVQPVSAPAAGTKSKEPDAGNVGDAKKD